MLWVFMTADSEYKTKPEARNSDTYTPKTIVLNYKSIKWLKMPEKKQQFYSFLILSLLHC